MFENQLLLIVGLQHERVFVETLDASGKLDSAHQINRDDAFFFARVVQKRILNILRRFVHGTFFAIGGNNAHQKKWHLNCTPAAAASEALLVATIDELATVAADDCIGINVNDRQAAIAQTINFFIFLS